MSEKNKKPIPDSTAPDNDNNSRRAFKGVVVAALIAALAAIIVAFINGWFGIITQKPPPDDGIYRVRVTVIDQQDVPVEDAKVWSTAGGEPKKVQGGWQFDIPKATKPPEGKLTLFASQETNFLRGQASLILTENLNPTATINLKPDDSAMVRGQVVDGKNRAIAGAQVFVVGYEANVVITKEGGNFEMQAHAAAGQTVILHAEKSGYDPVTQEHPAGNHPATLVLEKIR